MVTSTKSNFHNISTVHICRLPYTVATIDRFHCTRGCWLPYTVATIDRFQNKVRLRQVGTHLPHKLHSLHKSVKPGTTKSTWPVVQQTIFSPSSEALEAGGWRCWALFRQAAQYCYRDGGGYLYTNEKYVHAPSCPSHLYLSKLIWDFLTLCGMDWLWSGVWYLVAWGGIEGTHITSLWNWHC